MPSMFVAVVLSSAFIFSVVDAQMDVSTCGTMKGCLFAPPGCQPSTDCRIAFSYQVDGSYLNMELSGTPPTPNGFIAVGFSNDPLMGDDMVVYCANFAGQVAAGLAVNGQKPSNTIINNVGIQDVLRTSNIGGELYCEVNQRLDPNQSNLYNLNNTYQILLAAGPVDGNRLSYHQVNRYVLPRVSLPAYVKGKGLITVLDDGGGSSHDKLMIAHGILMTLAWSIFIGTAILFARHMKEHFPDSVYCGVKLWFHYHRTLNMIGIAGTIAGFVAVFVANDWRWIGPKANQSAEQNRQWGSVHAMLGLIACVVAWAQPLNAVFRCHPEDKGRFIFNWIHGFLGFGAWLCAALGIYIAFIVVTGLTVITMETLTFKRWWTNRDRVTSEIEMTHVGGSDSIANRNATMKSELPSNDEEFGSCTSLNLEISHYSSQIRAVQLLLLMVFVVVAIGASVAISVLIANR
ncbi:hypothetical protein Angca_002415, partial [Angiostrongylus cantonensis]